MDDFEFKAQQFAPVSYIFKFNIFLAFHVLHKILDEYKISLSTGAIFALCFVKVHALHYFFFQYLEACFSQLFQLLQDVTECDTKVRY